MNQVLHIFQKDARKHWLEIFISLTLLVLYTRRESPLWGKPPNTLQVGNIFVSAISGLITPALVIFWGFLILRVVQDETLVGDRQWWVTKPYIWWKLLAAKLLFVVTFISFPLFVAQLYLIRHAGFPMPPNVWSVVGMQFRVPLLIILISLLLACLTRNLGQALVGIGLALLYFISTASVLSELGSHEMQEPSKLWGNAESLLMLAPFVLVPIYQFARRRTWAARGVLISCVSASSLLSLIPGNSIDRSYPLVTEANAPAKLSISSLPQPKKPVPLRIVRETNLNIPVDASGIGQHMLVVVEGMRINADSSEDSRWSTGWAGPNVYLWPEIRSANLSYRVKHEEYERVKSKSLNLHVQLLLSEYAGTDLRMLRVLPGVFRDADLGFCRVHPESAAAIECRKLFGFPAYIARFDEARSSCFSAEQKAEHKLDEWGPAYASFILREPTEAAAGLNPIIGYELYLTFVLPPPKGSENSIESVALCPGAEVQIMQPKLQRKVRVQMDLPNRRLEEFAEDVPASSGETSYDLRSIL